MNFVYYSALLHSGTLDPQADSVGIPIFISIQATIVLTLPAVIATAIFARPDAGDILSWRRDRPVASAIISLPFGIVAAAGVGLIIVGLYELGFWFDLLPLLHLGLCVAWVLMARAGAIAILR